MDDTRLCESNDALFMLMLMMIELLLVSQNIRVAI
jgi:hypothetical protein